MNPRRPPRRPGFLAALALALFFTLAGQAVGAAADDAVPSVAAGSAPDTFHWSNPIRVQDGIPGDELRDPCIVREGDTYYLVFTVFPFRGRDENHLGDPDQGSSPGIKLYRSRDLANWTFDRWLVKGSELPDNCPYRHRFWAPEIHKMGGKFYLVFTADNWSKKEHNPAGTWGAAGYAFVGVADQVTGPYEHISYIPGAACDTTLFEDTDGRTYAFIPRYNIDVQEIDLTGLARGEVKLLGQPVKILTPDNADVGLATKADYLEGPWVRKIGDRYCLFYASLYSKKNNADGGDGYWAGVAYADRVTGPFQKDPRAKVFLGGHLAVFDDPSGGAWFSYRGESGGPAQGRLCVEPISLDASGRVRVAGPTTGPRTLSLHRTK